jgi:ribosome-binding protein aMBF1 (putative translation factor)
MKTTPFRRAEAEALAVMTPDERARFDAAEAREAARLQLAELVYAARTRAGLTQTELARRMNTKQSVISAIETGGQVPSVSMFWRVAYALNLHLNIELVDAGR